VQSGIPFVKSDEGKKGKRASPCRPARFRITIFPAALPPARSQAPRRRTIKNAKANSSIRASVAIALVFIAASSHARPLRYARALTIEETESGAIARVMNPWRGSSSAFTYVFYKRGSPRPARTDPSAVLIETPIRKAVALSSPYVAAIEALGALDSLVGVDNAAYIYSAKARARLAGGKAIETSRNGKANVELLIALSPDAVFAYGTGGEWDVHPALAKAGLPVIVCAEWMEDSPLGRAEWLKFFALFYDMPAAAETAFDAIEREYGSERDRVREEVISAGGKRPSVLANAPFQGAWNLPGGKSYAAALIRDAGGAYLWEDDPGPGGMTLSVEAVYRRASRAEIWINPGTASSLAELAALDPRFKGIPALARGAVFSNSRRLLPSGANDYFESAVFSPQILLKDFAAIFSAARDGTAKEPSSLEYCRILR
jgi:iron complex transport system substrate-binding protein